MAAKHRINLSISADLYADLDLVAGNLGVSRSALVAMLVEEPLRLLSVTLGLDLPQPHDEPIMRARGRSVDQIREIIKCVEAQYHSLFLGDSEGGDS